MRTLKICVNIVHVNFIISTILQHFTCWNNERFLKSEMYLVDHLALFQISQKQEKNFMHDFPSNKYDCKMLHISHLFISKAQMIISYVLMINNIRRWMRYFPILYITNYIWNHTELNKDGNESKPLKWNKRMIVK